MINYPDHPNGGVSCGLTGFKLDGLHGLGVGFVWRVCFGCLVYLGCIAFGVLGCCRGLKGSGSGDFVQGTHDSFAGFRLS